MKKKLYFINTNGYDAVISEDVEPFDCTADDMIEDGFGNLIPLDGAVRILFDSDDDLPDIHDSDLSDAERETIAKAWLETVEDDSSWRWLSKEEWAKIQDDIDYSDPDSPRIIAEIEKEL